MSTRLRTLTALTTVLTVSACAPGGEPDGDAPGATTGASSTLAARCAPDNGGLTLPDGFCAWVAVDCRELATSRWRPTATSSWPSATCGPAATRRS